MGFKQHISRTWQMIEQQVNDVPFRPHDEAEPLTGQKSISYKTPHSIDRGVFAKTNVRAFEEAHAILICNGLRGSIHISRL